MLKREKRFPEKQGKIPVRVDKGMGLKCPQYLSFANSFSDRINFTLLPKNFSKIILCMVANFSKQVKKTFF
jgi:hypothetical protein